jgi:hypothetical protein
LRLFTPFLRFRTPNYHFKTPSEGFEAAISMSFAAQEQSKEQK